MYEMADGGPAFRDAIVNRIVEYSQKYESAADRARRDALWLQQRVRLWRPLLLLADLFLWPLRAVQLMLWCFKAVFGIWSVLCVWYLLVCCVFMPYTSLLCVNHQQHERFMCHEQEDGFFFSREVNSQLDEIAMRAYDHFYRLWTALLLPPELQGIVKGCWFHPEIGKRPNGDDVDDAFRGLLWNLEYVGRWICEVFKRPSVLKLKNGNTFNYFLIVFFNTQRVVCQAASIPVVHTPLG